MKMNMNFISSFFSLLIVSSASYASHTLTSYEAIKNHLLTGKNMKVIVDAKNDCVLQSHDGQIPYSPNIVAIDVREFIIKAYDGSIHVGLQSSVNPPDKNIDPTYYTDEMTISPDGNIRIEDNAVSLVNFKKIFSIVELCTIGDKNKKGVKFIAP